jgi:general secretion pathway protein F
MPEYSYIAKKGPGEIVKGVVSAGSDQEVVSRLLEQGLFVVSVKPTGAFANSGSVARSVLSRSAAREFTWQLAMFLESDIDILEALHIICRQSRDRDLARLTADLAAGIREGTSFSDMLERYPRAFSRMYVRAVRSGERSGALGHVLRELADVLDKEESFRSTIREALIYPAFLAVVSAVTLSVLLTMVMPRLIQIFEGMNRELPISTQLLIAITAMIKGYWWVMLPVIAVIVRAAPRLLALEPVARRLDAFLLRLPKVGAMIRCVNAARFCRTLAMLLSSGVDMADALKLSADVVVNRQIRADARRLREEVSRGVLFSDSLEHSPYFPAVMVSLIRAGERTGNFSIALTRAALELESRTGRTLTAVARLFEPAVILVAGLVIGYIVMAMILPVFQITSFVK